MNKLFPIDSSEKELCFLCCLGIVYYDYMPLAAKKLYDNLTEQEMQEIKKIISENKLQEV